MTAHDDEQRRLRLNLHDGLGPQLAGCSEAIIKARKAGLGKAAE